jgi:DNA invertase Pin-like site-specific DNA recombinase
VLCALAVGARPGFVTNVATLVKERSEKVCVLNADAVLAAVAEFERDLIRERTKAGMKAAKSRGILIGRKTIVTEEQLAHAKLLVSTGNDVTIRHIATSVGVSRGTAWRLRRKIEDGLV